jgi:hypothetical protein
MKIFEDKELQDRFEKTKELYEQYRSVVTKKVDFTNPNDILHQLGELSNVAHLGAECEAMFEFLNDKHAMKKLAVLDMETRGAAEKKIILNNEIGSTNFWLTITRLLVKEAHYNSDRLRSALSYLKQEMSSL